MLYKYALKLFLGWIVPRMPSMHSKQPTFKVVTDYTSLVICAKSLVFNILSLSIQSLNAQLIFILKLDQTYLYIFYRLPSSRSTGGWILVWGPSCRNSISTAEAGYS